MRSFYEFFAGGGMARAGLGGGWNCAFANDFDHKKSASYRENWRDGAMRTGDVKEVSSNDLPGIADLAWASFPCQDLSLAGGGAGLKGERSGTFWPFWRLMRDLGGEGRAPSIVALENVCGALTSHDGRDFAAIGAALVREGYAFGALVVDAAAFLPHSRPRLFIIAVKAGLTIPKGLVASGPRVPWHTRQLREAHGKLPPEVAAGWIWWDVSRPVDRERRFADILETDLPDAAWHAPKETARLLAMMSPLNVAKVDAARRADRPMVGCVYKRTRRDAADGKVQRAEIRFDEISGCLRTPAGGSSRQVIVIVEADQVRSRLITARETARLMGLPEAYVLPRNYNDAYHLTGDGVAVPVVRHLAMHILEPIIDANEAAQVAA